MRTPGFIYILLIFADILAKGFNFIPPGIKKTQQVSGSLVTIGRVILLYKY
jgi:hypothetical protein